tara:strand:- start:1128 stop:1355 length:228 start_codon:yes stop_codon:yes gene_type:complete
MRKRVGKKYNSKGGIIFPAKKKFNNKVYTLKKTFGRKSSYKNFKNEMMRRGYFVRLYESKQSERAHRYAMYVRKK